MLSRVYPLQPGSQLSYTPRCGKEHLFSFVEGCVTASTGLPAELYPQIMCAVSRLPDYYISCISKCQQENEKFFHPFRSEEHTSELQSRFDLVCRLLLEK